MAYIFDLSDAWANGATTFTAIKMNVSDGGSAAASMLMDLQVGSESRFRVGKQLVTVNNGAALINVPAGNSDAGITIAATNAGGGARLTFSDGLQLGNQGTFDVILRRDAANTLAQRNGVNAQAFNLYNTYTDASNYERGFMRFVSNTLRIGTEKLGTGTAQALELHTDGVARLTLATTGIVTIDATEFNANVNTIRFISAETGGQDTLTFGSVSTDIDFAFKGSSNVNLIWTDGGTNALGFFGATPAARPTTAIAAATFAANTSGIADDTATFGGYTMGQVVQALRNLGFLT